MGSLAAIAVVLLWFIPARMYGADTATEAVQSGMGENLFRNTLGRFLLGVSKAQPPWYYLETLPVDMMPWTLVAPPVLYWGWKQRKSSKSMWVLFSWLVPAIVFFSISIGKRELYLLPLLPAMAILFGAALVHLRNVGNLKWIFRGGLLWSILLIAFACAPLALPLSPFQPQEAWRVWLLAATSGLAGVGGLAYLLKRGAPLTPPIMALQTLVLYSMVVLTAYPEIDHFKSARPICQPVRALADAGAEFRLYSFGFSREEYVYYARHFHEPVLTGLVGDISPDDMLDQAKLQKDAKKTIVKAVDKVPVADLQHITVEERQALMDAIETAVNAHKDAEAIRAFEGELQKAITGFFMLLNKDTPAFAFIQEEDWRWLVPLYPGDIPATILVDHLVGSRHALLLANDAGVALVNQAR
jgi:4-amino-4-deoxy-L-arabinose transferase-like glycosyltransferase